MSREPDRLYSLLPAVYQRRDAAAGGALRDLLGVIGEQVDVVANDIAQLYDDWFIETCADWVVPYLGDLVGYRMLPGYEEAASAGGEAARELAARLAPRADVADTVALRRRKGTLALLEELAMRAAGWPARAVELERLLASAQPVRLWPPDDAVRARRLATARGQLTDVRKGNALARAGGPFDELAHTAEIRRITSHRREGRYHTRAVGVFVWRLKPYAVSRTPAYGHDPMRRNFTFSVLGNNTPLVTRPVPEPNPNHIAEPENVPAFVSRRELSDHLADFYGPGKSFCIWRGADVDPVPMESIVVADLTRWRYNPGLNRVAVDPELGRIAFPARRAPKRGVWVTYHHAFSDDTGGGEYTRRREETATTVYQVGEDAPFRSITAAYQQWQTDKDADPDKANAAIEITDNGTYQEQLEFAVTEGDRLELRAAVGRRPVIRLLDWYSNRPDALYLRGDDIIGQPDPDASLPRVVLDGLLITGRGIEVTGTIGTLVLRHCTLVPGWTLEPNCDPVQHEEPSLVLECTTACVQVERSILGSIMVNQDEVDLEPLPVHIADSIVDATDSKQAALYAPGCRHAHVELHIARSTVIGEVYAHAIARADDSIFVSCVHVARRQHGCVRFCFMPMESRVPRRYHCQPETSLRREDIADDERRLVLLRLRPRFVSRRYGTPAYAQLALSCPEQITRGAEDGSEMGAFHHLFQPQRTDLLQARLTEFTPAGTDAGIVFVT